MDGLMAILGMIGKVFVVIECAVVGIFCWAGTNDLKIHTLFCIALTILAVICSYAILTHTKKVCRIIQVLLGIAVGYYVVFPFAISFVEKPDNIWHYGLLILSVVVCVAMHLIVSTISESERNPIQEDYIITTITEREIPQ